jgi:hypothetical protein
MDLNVFDGIELEKSNKTVEPVETAESTQIKDAVTNNDPIPKDPIKISRDKFRILSGCIGLMPGLACTDCDIKNGFVRQPDNYGNSIIELDLTSILNERSLSISNVKDKYAAMKALEVDDSVDWSKEDLLLVEFDKGYQILDKESVITFKKPVASLMGNSFITTEQLNSKADTNDKNMIFTLQIKPHMIKRIADMCESMGTDIITVEMKDSKGTIYVRNKNNTDEMQAKVITNFDLDKKVPISNFSFSSLPFRVNFTTELTLKLFKQTKNCLVFFEQKLFNSITFRIYTLVRVINS